MPDGFFHRPPALAGIGGVVGDLGQTGIFLQCLDQQLEEPRPHHRAVGPGPQGAGDVLDEWLGIEDLVALAVGVHQSVFDAVVHHLGVVPGADLPGVDESVRPLTRGPQRVENRHGAFDVLFRTAAHQAVTVLQAPDTAGHSAIDVTDSLGTQQFCVDRVVGVLGVAAIDDEIAG